MFRLLLRRAVDSSWFGTVDSMIVTRSSIYWPGVTPGIEPDTARYGVSCGASTDSVFLSMDAERGDTNNSIQRAYVMVMDTDTTAQPASVIDTSRSGSDNTQPLPQAPGSQQQGLNEATPLPDTSSGGAFNKAQTSPQASGSQQQASDAPQTSGSQLQELDVSVHPNPVRGSVKICVADLPEGIQATVDVVNDLGVQIAKLYDATPDAELGLCLQMDCSHLPSGTYYADLSTQGLHKAVEFSIQH